MYYKMFKCHENVLATWTYMTSWSSCELVELADFTTCAESATTEGIQDQHIAMGCALHNTPMVIMVQNEVWQCDTFLSVKTCWVISWLRATSKRIYTEKHWQPGWTWIFFKDRDADTNGSQEPKHISSLTATDTWEHHWTALQRIAEGRVLFKAPMPMHLRTRALRPCTFCSRSHPMS